MIATALAFAAAAALVLLAGGLPWRLPWLAAPGARTPRAFAAGALALHVLLGAMTMARLPWSALGVTLVVLSVWLALGAAVRFETVVFPRPRLAAGVALAIVVAALLAVAVWRGRATTPDFVYHWGFKAERFLLDGGFDPDFFAGPSLWRTHPDYPTLVPKLYALPGLLAGGFDPRAALLWTPAWLALLALAAQRALARAGADGFATAAGAALVATVPAAFALGDLALGAADWLPALALVLALPALTAARPIAADTAELAAAAGLAAAAKIEGLPLAAILVLLHVARAGRWESPRSRLGRLLPAALPALAAAVAWFAIASRHHLFLASNTGAWDWSRGRELWPAFFQVLARPPWHGAPYLLAALPLLVARRDTRRGALAIALQLGVYLAIYYTGPLDTRFYVLSSLPRLLLHLIPALIVLATLAWSTPRDLERAPGSGRIAVA
ncbi:MAG: hypothetical protein U0X73_14105 [Thermoanaerobaculia bacterium]